MRIAPEGRPFLLGVAVPAVLAWAAAFWIPGPAVPLGAGILTLLALFVLYFFRDPERRGPSDPALVLAPADGRVVEVSEVDEQAFMGGRCRRISIFLSIFDVHVQRAPLSGRVAYRDDRAGGYAVAWKPKASEENERADVGIETGVGRVLVRQIAGLVARRIVTDPAEGDEVVRGRRIGIIRFGSRVDLFLPLDWSVECAAGDRARTAQTVLARTEADTAGAQEGPGAADAPGAGEDRP